ncbi:MAG: YegS/Rv2252/BmrU family lipid kinase [Filifactoraceae bacterium]
MRKALFVYNPMSGDRFVANNLDTILSILQSKDFVLTIYRIGYMDDNPRKLIKMEDMEIIIAAGGDGTLKDVVQWMFDEGVEKPLLALGAGTCNNFTTNIDIVKDITLALDALLEGRVRSVDIGLINHEIVFLSSLAGGMFVDTSYKTDGNLKQVLGPLAYYLKPINELTNIKSYKVRVETRDEVIEESVFLFLLLNGKSVGNFQNFINLADVSDGMMEMVLILDTGNPLESADLFFTIVRGESFVNKNNVIILKSDYFNITTVDEDMKTSIDGEAGIKMPFEVKVIKEAIKVFVPK